MQIHYGESLWSSAIYTDSFNRKVNTVMLIHIIVIASVRQKGLTFSE